MRLDQYETHTLVRQRYGGNENASNDSTDFETTLPEFHLDYVSAGPVDSEFSQDPEEANANDRTAGFLPLSVQNMYPLETLPDSALRPEPTCANTSGCVEPGEVYYQETIATNVNCGDSADFEERTSCSVGIAYEQQEVLPGFLPTYDYFQLQDAEPRKIYRSHMTCEQLAEAQLGDPFHNDNINHGDVDAEGMWDFHIPPGHRARIESDLRRICQWAEVVDRDGDRRFYGLNFHGRILVEAVEDQPGNEAFVFHETLYNADGNIVERRDPKRGDTAVGVLRYEYDEVDPTGPPTPGSEGVNEWLPAWCYAAD